MKVCKSYNNVTLLLIVGQLLRYYERIGLITNDVCKSTTKIVAQMCTMGTPIGIDKFLCSFRCFFCHMHSFDWMCTCCVN